MRDILLALLLVLVTSGCAQPPKETPLHVSTYKNEFSTRMSIAVNYHRRPDFGVVVVDVSNPRTIGVRLWLVQVSETDGQRIIAARRFYSGYKKKHQEVFKVPLPQEGINESFRVEAFDESSRLLMKSESITTNKEGKL